MAVTSIENHGILVSSVPQQPLAVQVETSQLSPNLTEFRMDIGLTEGEEPIQRLKILQNGHLQIATSVIPNDLEGSNLLTVEPEEVVPLIQEHAPHTVAAAAIYHAGKWLISNAPNTVAGFSSAIPEYSASPDESLDILHCFDEFYEKVQAESQRFYGSRSIRGYNTPEEGKVRFTNLTTSHQTVWKKLINNYGELPEDHLVLDLATHDLARASESLFDSSLESDLDQNMADLMMRQQADMFRRRRVIDHLSQIIRTQAAA